MIPMASVWPSGVTAIETIVGAVTVRVVLCEMLAKDAEMVVVPAATVAASPLASMVAAAVDEAHVTNVVMSALLPSL